MTARPNRLAGEASLYLRQHADNPVDWYPWGEEALAAARERDCPILLSIGYSSCHWCHVMAHECFENEAIAAQMNAGFVCVKVDREERPDLDRIYQTAHQLLAGRGGGWPLTVFLTPDQEPFFAGTYFPAEPRHGLPSLPHVLERVGNAWHEQRESIGEHNERMRAALDELQQPPADGDATTAESAFGVARDRLGQAFDEPFGGFGAAPKFPQPAVLQHLLRHYAANDDRQALHMACHTLRRMGLGGIFDQVGGGFARYSVDRHWMIPHFEKMLSDNALLLGLYADAWQITGNELFARIADETVEWLFDDMRLPGGAFATALDADTAEGEGAYYLWTPKAVREALPDDAAELVIRRFGLDERANFHGRWHLHVHATFSELAAGLRLQRDQVVALWQRARRQLQHVRAQRVAPERDEKVLTAWNALTARGLAHAGRVLGRDDWIDAAADTLTFLDGHLWRDGRLLARWADGEAAHPAYLDDHAFLLWALLEQLEARWEQRWFVRAESVASLICEHFEHPNAGGFYFTADDHERLIQRPYGFADDALPAGAAVAARCLQRVSALTGESRYQVSAERAADAAAAAVTGFPEAHCSMLDAIDEITDPGATVLIRATAGDDTGRWRQAAREHFAPKRQVFVLADDAPSAVGPERGARVCIGHHCLPEAATAEELADRLRP